ncbi:MAG: B12-binding domain-containing radical SAM protein [Planctomycetes bacterium]|nr:B12-binding domain-containing radical SAM protein [Planctomycetota bacterium]
MKKQRVVLFLPSRVDPTIGDLPAADLQPLELIHIASPAEAAGYEVIVIDAMTEPDYLQKVIKACDGALAFGSSCILGFQVWDGAVVSEAVRKTYPKLPIFWGGWFPSSVPELYLTSGWCDAVCMGQGEETFPEMLKAAEEGPRMDQALEKVDGLALWRDGHMIQTTRRPTKHLNELPPPSFHLIDLQKYYELNKKTAPHGHRIRNRLPSPPPFDKPEHPYRGLSYFSSFGCPEPCEFCCSPEIAGRRWVALDPEVMVDRIHELYKKDPFDILRLQDANFGVAEKRTRIFCEKLIDSGMKIRWNGTVEIKQICQYSDSTIDLLRDSGCHLLWFGAEAATEQTQDLIRKHIRVGQTAKAMERINARGIRAGLSYIIGYPNESRESMLETIREAAELTVRFPHSTSEVFPYRPIPGSGFWQPSLDAGYVSPTNFEGWGRFFDYKFNSWMGNIPEDVQKVWWRYTALAPWSNGHAGGRGPFSKLLRRSARTRLSKQKYAAPFEFKFYDLAQRIMGPRLVKAL